MAVKNYHIAAAGCQNSITRRRCEQTYGMREP